MSSLNFAPGVVKRKGSSQFLAFLVTGVFLNNGFFQHRFYCESSNQYSGKSIRESITNLRVTPSISGVPGVSQHDSMIPEFKTLSLHRK